MPEEHSAARARSLGTEAWLAFTEFADHAASLELETATAARISAGSGGRRVTHQ